MARAELEGQNRRVLAYQESWQEARAEPAAWYAASVAAAGQEARAEPAEHGACAVPAGKVAWVAWPRALFCPRVLCFVVLHAVCVFHWLRVFMLSCLM